MIMLISKSILTLTLVVGLGLSARPQDSNSVSKYLADGDKPILTPEPKPQPRINGPLVYGARPGNQFLYRIPCQGERPIWFSVSGLPKELVLDENTGLNVPLLKARLESVAGDGAILVTTVV